MRVLIVGAGGVGSALTTICARRDCFENIVVADVDSARSAKAAATALDHRVSSTRVDVSDRLAIVDLAAATGADVIVNACDPLFNPSIFEAAFEADCHYLDMAMHLSTPHPTDPHNQIGVTLGAAQFDASEAWAGRGLLALVGMGVEPGFSDIAARYAADHLFSTINEIGVRDGSDLLIEGFAFAPTCNIWTTIEECLNPPIIYERDRGWFTTAPFSGPELFRFPEGIGELKCVNVEHEEVLLIPRWIDVDRVTFKYGLGDEFLEVLTTLHKLGLDSTEPITVRGVDVTPRDLVAALLPNPAALGHRMSGRTCAGTLVTGIGADGSPRSTYIYQIVDNEWTMAEFSHQAVVWQTAVHPAVALEMLATGEWKGEGVKGPEAFSADPFLPLLAEHGAPWSIEERSVPRRPEQARSSPG